MKDHPYYKEVQLIVDKLISNGIQLIGFNDGDYKDVTTFDIPTIIEGVLSVDESEILIKHDEKCGSVMIVLGNEDGVAMADYSYSRNNPETGKLLDKINGEVYNEMNPDEND
jgi:hypothetical protein